MPAGVDVVRGHPETLGLSALQLQEVGDIPARGFVEELLVLVVREHCHLVVEGHLALRGGGNVVRHRAALVHGVRRPVLLQGARGQVLLDVEGLGALRLPELLRLRAPALALILVEQCVVGQLRAVGLRRQEVAVPRPLHVKGWHKETLLRGQLLLHQGQPDAFVAPHSVCQDPFVHVEARVLVHQPQEIDHLDDRGRQLHLDKALALNLVLGARCAATATHGCRAGGSGARGAACEPGCATKVPI
mmetsp:Transcript_76589/g.247892  ORF Transcript_76589/g.247892 Transcript_76589/m.247892 type:complete len:246 (+) Transcript_76589:1468-2205(+)